mgnify:CR=1 FL=1
MDSDGLFAAGERKGEQDALAGRVVVVARLEGLKADLGVDVVYGALEGHGLERVEQAGAEHLVLRSLVGLE